MRKEPATYRSPQNQQVHNDKLTQTSYQNKKQRSSDDNTHGGSAMSYSTQDSITPLFLYITNIQNLYTFWNNLPARLDSVNTLTSSRQQSSLNSRCSCEEGMGWTVSSLGGDTEATSNSCGSRSRGTQMRDSRRDRHSAQVSESSTWSPFRLDSTHKLWEWLLDSIWGLLKLPWRDEIKSTWTLAIEYGSKSSD